MNVAYRSDRKSGVAQVAGISRSPLLRLPMRSDFCRQSKNHELLAPSASDCAWSGWKAKDQRRRSRLEAECLAEFKPTADLSTYRRGKSVRTTRATAWLHVAALLIGGSACTNTLRERARSCGSSIMRGWYSASLEGLNETFLLLNAWEAVR